MESHDDLPPRPQRGLKSKSPAPLSIVPAVRPRRPAPPQGLSVAEQEIWREITESVRADWFRGASEFLLECYVRMLSSSRDLAAAYRETEVGSDRYMDLVGLHRTVVMAAANLAVKLRLTVRSTHDRYTPRAVSAEGPRPWEDDCVEPDPAA
jgi:hypothetical protein